MEAETLNLTRSAQVHVRIRLCDHILSALCQSELTHAGRRFIEKLKAENQKIINDELDNLKKRTSSAYGYRRTTGGI